MNNDEQTVVRDLLRRWQLGEIDEQQVHMDAEFLFEKLRDEMERPSEELPDSIVYEALSQLSLLPYQLITPEDIPAFLQFLDSIPGEVRKGWQTWRRYWDSLDIEKRRTLLKNNPYYSTHSFPQEREH